ncbi:MAG: FAD-binding oxidoreductase [Acidobacteriota bacterium]
MSPDELRGKFDGDVVTPTDADYDNARRVWNGMIDMKPALIARCSSTEDVCAAVKFARDTGLELAVRGGGHNVAGNGTCDGGLVIDLGAMTAVEVDPDRRIAVAQGGATWGDYDRATQEHGLASPGGAISTTGIGGLTLGGGFGWLSRSYGLACDNLLSAEMVTAEGEIVTASADENPDLFWGLRGGGGNFGIVTRFTFQLYPVGDLYAGLILYPRDRAAEFMRGYGRVTASAPDTFSSMAAFLSTPEGDPVVGAFVVHRGDAGAGTQIADQLRSLGAPLVDDTGLKPYCEVQQAFDPGFPKGSRNYWKACFLTDLSDECCEVLIQQANQAPTPISLMAVEHLMGGAAARVPSEATAFGARDAEYNLLILGMGNEPGQDDAIRRWVRDSWRAVQPFASGATYVNYMDADESDRIAEAYSSTTYQRLVELKDRYDPQNRFHRNQNIAPSSNRVDS